MHNWRPLCMQVHQSSPSYPPPRIRGWQKARTHSSQDGGGLVCADADVAASTAADRNVETARVMDAFPIALCMLTFPFIARFPAKPAGTRPEPPTTLARNGPSEPGEGRDRRRREFGAPVDPFPLEARFVRRVVHALPVFGAFLRDDYIALLAGGGRGRREQPGGRDRQRSKDRSPLSLH